MGMDYVQFSEIVRNWTVAVATVVGGVWILFRWGWPSRRNPYLNAEAIDGDISLQVTPLSDHSCIASVGGLWRNRGDFTVELDPSQCGVLVFRHSNTLKPGQLEPGTDEEAQHKRFVEFDRLELEAKTESIWRFHFVLETGPVYLFLFRLVSKRPERRWWQGTEPEKYKWRRSMVWNSADRKPVGTSVGAV
jgi:hypothetical protein